ncbi:MAG: hypothetical protein ABIH83_03670 [Candidatus Micrarchaeota archaeon]
MVTGAGKDKYLYSAEYRVVMGSITQSWGQLSLFNKIIAAITIIGFFIAILFGIYSAIQNYISHGETIEKIGEEHKQTRTSIENETEKIDTTIKEEHDKTNARIGKVYDECVLRNSELSNQLKECEHVPVASGVECRNRTIVMKYGMGMSIDNCNSPAFTDGFVGLSNEATMDVWFILYPEGGTQRFLFDFGNDLESSDRLSAFVENGILKFRAKKPYSFGEGVMTTKQVKLEPEVEYGATLMVNGSYASLYIFHPDKGLIFEDTKEVSETIDLSSTRFVLGADLELDNVLYGAFDELRISGVSRSKDWIIATHTLSFTVGPEQKIERR